MRDALQDADEAERSLGRFTTARAFIVGHELGHVLGCDDSPNRIEREKCADRLGARVVSDFMRRTEVAPLRVVIYFMAAVHWNLNQADFASRQEWDRYIQNSDHPLTPDRLDALASQLEGDTGGNRSMLAVASKIRSLAAFTADEDVLRGIILVARAGDSMHVSDTPRQAPGTERLAFQGTFSGTMAFLNDREDGPGRLVMSLARRGDTVTGRYTFGLGDATLQRKIISGKLYFQWRWGQVYGNGVMQASQHGAGIRGTWGLREASGGVGMFECSRQ